MPPKLNARQLFWGGLALLAASLLLIFVVYRIAQSDSESLHSLLATVSPYVGYLNTVLEVLGSVAIAGSFLVRAVTDEPRVRTNRSPVKGDDQVWS
ncbi:hypothetical protein [Luteimicrobium sp. DT211]|uniref:hypothetical protein n=1 Tax=Luteimicrobium sp. DT211 TaxID=3393412 RepID=UPI003CF9D3CA